MGEEQAVTQAQLVVHPFLGEFGWEIMRWQAHARHVSRRHSRAVVFCKQGMEHFYSDFATELYPLDIRGGTPDCWGRKDYTIVPNENRRKYDNLASCRDMTHLVADREKMTRRIRQEFLPLGKKRDDFKYDLIIHARSDDRATERNWPRKYWDELVFLLHGGLEIASIGHPDGAMLISGTKDLRGITLSNLCNTLRSSNLCIGPSSGPMHLSSLCECKHLVWTDKKRWCMGMGKAGTNRQRYGSYWNPFETKNIVVDQFGWQPNPQQIYPFVVEAIL